MRAEHLLFVSTDKHGTTTFKVTGGGFNMDTVENEYLNKYSPLIFISISIFLTTPAWLLNKLQLLTTSETHSGSETRSSESVSRLLSTDSDGDMKPSTQTEASFRSTETWSDPVFLPHSVSNAAGCFFFFYFNSTLHSKTTKRMDHLWRVAAKPRRRRKRSSLRFHPRRRRHFDLNNLIGLCFYLAVHSQTLSKQF